MFIRKILKIVLLNFGIIAFAISINLIIQKKIQDVENKNANDNLFQIITKKAETEEQENKNVNLEMYNTEETEDCNQMNNDENINVQERLETKEQIIKLAIEDNKIINTKDKIDWNKLSSINKDIVGWIEIPNTNINYPILKDENLYYLNHNYDGKTNRNGSIFIRNNDLFESEEITIYGHNMKNGTMFATLAKYINKDFLANNSKFYIYTKENTYEGHIFAAYSKGVDHDKGSIIKLGIDERIEYYKNQGDHLKKIENNIDKIVKLTTCSYINARTSPTDQRYYIIAEMKIIN